MPARLRRISGFPLKVLTIEEIFGSFLDSLDPVFEGKKPDTPEENIQARIRRTLLMAYSNKFNSLLLTTGNKSELASRLSGTLYGETSGGLAVIGELPKGAGARPGTFHQRARSPLIPGAIIDKPPSAELRPESRLGTRIPCRRKGPSMPSSPSTWWRTAPAEAQSACGFPATLVRSVVKHGGKGRVQAPPGPASLKVSPMGWGTGSRRRIPIARRFFYKLRELLRDPSSSSFALRRASTGPRLPLPSAGFPLLVPVCGAERTTCRGAPGWRCPGTAHEVLQE